MPTIACSGLIKRQPTTSGRVEIFRAPNFLVGGLFAGGIEIIIESTWEIFPALSSRFIQFIGWWMNILINGWGILTCCQSFASSLSVKRSSSFRCGFEPTQKRMKPAGAIFRRPLGILKVIWWCFSHSSLFSYRFRLSFRSPPLNGFFIRLRPFALKRIAAPVRWVSYCITQGWLSGPSVERDENSAEWLENSFVFICRLCNSHLRTALRSTFTAVHSVETREHKF